MALGGTSWAEEPARGTATAGARPRTSAAGALQPPANPSALTSVRITRRGLLVVGGAALLATGLAACSSRSEGPKDDGGSGLVPEPEGVIVTRWRADPYARGAYSYLAVGATPDDRVALASPIDDRLYFAGEATDPDFPATVHGALASGRRAADAVAAVAAPGESVLIIGAGAAGLAAAQRLSEESVEYEVVEARERIGGRVHTSEALGAPVDLGASWIHGPDGNPLSALADEAGIDLLEIPSEVVIFSRASEISAARAGELEMLAGAILEQAAFSAQPGESLGSAIGRAVSARNLSARDEAQVRAAIALRIDDDLAAGPDQLSAQAAVEGDELDGGDVLPVGGYAPIIAELADDVDVRLGTPIAAIRHADAGVTVRAMSGAAFTADRVIVTLPLGVLAANAVEFDPPLPAAKLAAIDRLGVGDFAKVALRFPSTFLPSGIDGLIDISSPRDVPNQWVDISEAAGAPILVGVVGGPDARRLEQLSDAQATAQSLALLRAMV